MNLFLYNVSYNPNQQLKLVGPITWAFWHTERILAGTGLNLLVEMLKNFQGPFYFNFNHVLLLDGLVFGHDS